MVHSFRRAVGELTARADKLTEEYRQRIARERLRQQSAIKEFDENAEKELARIKADFEARVAAADATLQRRKAWIGKAFQSSNSRRLQQIEDFVGAQRYGLQKTMLQAEKDREAGLAAAATKRKEFLEQLAAEEAALAAAEREAQAALAGYKRLQTAFLKAYQDVTPAADTEPDALFGQLQEALSRASDNLREVQRLPLLGLFRHLALWLALALGIALLPLLSAFGLQTYPFKTGAIAGGLVFAAALLLRIAGLAQARRAAADLSANLARARRLHDDCAAGAETAFQTATERIQSRFRSTQETAEQKLRQAMSQAGELRVARRMQSDEKAVRAGRNNERMHQERLAFLDRARATALAEARQKIIESKAVLEASGRDKLSALEQECERARQALAQEWDSTLRPIYEALERHNAESARLFPPWTHPSLKDWIPPGSFCAAARFGALAIDVAELCGTLPKDKRLALPGPARLEAALTLVFPEEASLLVETAETGHDLAIAALNNVVLRLLSVTPPGRLAFTILDPVGLGQNFAGIMHLADFDEQLIHDRIWTQSTQIEQRLADLNEHMEKVIQMYLRNEYATIADYNRQAGVIAEKYHFLVVADFPANFTDVAAKRLMSIAASGARCGVFLLMHWDRRLPLPAEFIPQELRKSAFVLSVKGHEVAPAAAALPGTTVQLDLPPPPEAAIEFVQRVGGQSRDASRVEVPFEHVAPKEAELWTMETTSELRVAIGRTGATKLQYLALGKGTCQHGLVAGKTGSGKSTLFHVIVTNLSLWCSPEQVEFYLVDFKKGVEFKPYAVHRLPHARVVAIESDREFALSVLQRVDDELRRRGELFRKAGVQDLPAYKRTPGAGVMPRTLLLVDEFQEFFVEDDKVAQTSSLLLDRLVRQGRAFGIHVLLGSQTLGGAYTVARTTLGQMVVRIALQCNEADAYLIMDDSNPAPRLLSRPGEGIYNDTAGTLEGNSPFQVVWLPEQTRERCLRSIRQKADAAGLEETGPLVFEGNAPADVRENAELRRQLHAEPQLAPVAGRIWLGAPNSIKGPTEVVFKRQSGNHLLTVGQREEAMLAMLGISLVSIAAQYPPEQVRLLLLDSTPPESPERRFLERVVGMIPHPIQFARPAEVDDVMAELAREMQSRSEMTDPDSAPTAYLIINGLQRFSRLRHQEEFSFSTSESEASTPGAVLGSVLTEGARLGIHVIVFCDTYNSVSRYLSRKAMSEFELRVLFQMSAADSASLIDNPKAALLGLHRALFHNAQEGYLETFRPYALPEPGWLDEVSEALAKRRAADARSPKSEVRS